jgi:glutamate--cysteine ligase
MRDAVPHLAFKTPFRNTTVWELAQRMLDISAEGLKRRAALDGMGMTEEGFLMPLRELVSRGYTRAEELLQKYRTDWGKDLNQIFTEYNFL